MKTYPLALGSVGLISGLLLFSSADAVDTEDVKPNPRAVDTSSSFQNPANVINASTSPVFELRHNVRHPQASDAAIRLIVSPGRRILERIDRVHSLSTNLNVEEIHDLYAFLTAAPAKNENLPALHYLKNEIFTALRNQGTFPAGLTEVMIAISEDSRQDLVTRDYALQHLSIWCGEGAEDEAGSAQRIRNTLIQAAQQPTTLAGTALLGLHRL